jgi:hypothetical protein
MKRILCLHPEEPNGSAATNGKPKTAGAAIAVRLAGKIRQAKSELG